MQVAAKLAANKIFLFQRLNRLQQRVAGVDVRDAQRPARERRVDEAEEARRPPEEVQRPVLPEAARKLGVDELVRRDPGRRDARRRPEAQERRHAHEQAEHRRNEREHERQPAPQGPGTPDHVSLRSR